MASTATDVAPYLQAWLDARAPLTTAQTNYANAKTGVETAHSALQTAVTSGGKTAAQATTEIQNYINAQATYVAAEAAVKAAQQDLETKRANAEKAVNICAAGGTVQPFGSQSGP